MLYEQPGTYSEITYDMTIQKVKPVWGFQRKIEAPKAKFKHFLPHKGKGPHRSAGAFVSMRHVP